MSDTGVKRFANGVPKISTSTNDYDTDDSDNDLVPSLADFFLPAGWTKPSVKADTERQIRQSAPKLSSPARRSPITTTVSGRTPPRITSSSEGLRSKPVPAMTLTKRKPYDVDTSRPQGNSSTTLPRPQQTPRSNTNVGQSNMGEWEAKKSAFTPIVLPPGFLEDLESPTPTWPSLFEADEVRKANQEKIKSIFEPYSTPRKDNAFQLSSEIKANESRPVSNVQATVKPEKVAESLKKSIKTARKSNKVPKHKNETNNLETAESRPEKSLPPRHPASSAPSHPASSTPRFPASTLPSQSVSSASLRLKSTTPRRHASLDPDQLASPAPSLSASHSAGLMAKLQMDNDIAKRLAISPRGDLSQSPSIQSLKRKRQSSTSHTRDEPPNHNNATPRDQSLLSRTEAEVLKQPLALLTTKNQASQQTNVAQKPSMDINQPSIPSEIAFGNQQAQVPIQSSSKPSTVTPKTVSGAKRKSKEQDLVMTPRRVLEQPKKVHASSEIPQTRTATPSTGKDTRALNTLEQPMNISSHGKDLEKPKKLQTVANRPSTPSTSTAGNGSGASRRPTHPKDILNDWETDQLASSQLLDSLDNATQSPERDVETPSNPTLAERSLIRMSTRESSKPITPSYLSKSRSATPRVMIPIVQNISSSPSKILIHTREKPTPTHQTKVATASTATSEASSEPPWFDRTMEEINRKNPFHGKSEIYSTDPDIARLKKLAQPKAKTVRREDIKLDWGGLPVINQEFSKRLPRDPVTQHDRITSRQLRGIQGMPVKVVNEVNNKRLDGNVQFITKNIVSAGIRSAHPDAMHSCSCVGDCDPRFCDCFMNSEDPQNPGKLVPYMRTKSGMVVLRPEYIDLEEGYEIQECNERCRCGPGCWNRVVQRGRTVPLEIFMTEKCGFGLRSPWSISKGQFIDTYIGELITTKELIQREELRAKASDGNHKSYAFSLDYFETHDIYQIDSENFGSPTRFINHSCDPNCRVFTYMNHNGDHKVYSLAFFAIRDIAPYEELGFDYSPQEAGLSDDEDESNIEARGGTRCYCGAANCKKILWGGAKGGKSNS